MGAGSLFLVPWPEKAPFSPYLCFLVCPKSSEFLVQNLDFHPKRAFSLPPGRGCCIRSKKSPLLEARECNAPKTRHHSQIEDALCLCRLFQVTLVSPLMSLGHYRSEISIISPAQTSGTAWAPISCRSLPGGRDFSANNLFFWPHLFGLH